MAMVRRLSEAMLRTDDVQTQAQLGLAFHRVSRAVRQTMALEFRLAQGARREDRAEAAPARPRPPAETAPARAPAERTGWSEYESDDSNEAFDELDELLEAEDLDLEAVHEAVETCIARIRRDLDAEPALAGASLLASAAPPTLGRAKRPLGSGRGRSQLMSGAALADPIIAAPRPGPWRSSA
jgi:hypothetical protein